MKKKFAACFLAAALLASLLPLGALAASETEPNDTAAQATVLSNGVAMTGNIASPYEKDYYRIDVPNNGSIVLTYDFTAGVPNQKLALLNGQDNKELYSWDFNSDKTSYPFVSHKVRVPQGTYFVLIERYGTPSADNYSIKYDYVDESNSPAEVEFNDSVSTATPINNGVSMTGNLYHAYDKDYYKIDVPNNGSIVVTYNFAGGGVPNHAVGLYDAQGEKLCEDTFSSDKTFYPYSHSKYRVPAGTYYISVDRYGTPSMSDYSIQYDYVDESSATAEKEINDAVNTATPISLNQKYVGNMHHAYDKDYYSFTLSSAKQVKMVYNFTGGVPNQTMKILSSSGEKMLSQDFNSDKQSYPFTSAGVSLPAGTYCVLVERYGTPSAGDYTIMITDGGTATEKPPEVTPPPTTGDSVGGFTVESITVGAKLWWKSLTGGVGYRVYRSDSPSSEGISVTDFYITSNEFVDVNVDANTTYYYTVRQVIKEARPFEGLAEVLGPVSAVIQVTTADSILGGNSSDTGGKKKNFILMTLDDPMMSVNGVRKEIDPGRGTSPIIKNSRTIVPIRAIVEAMGGVVGWDQSAQRIDLKSGNKSVVMTVGSKSIKVDGSAKTMDVVPEVINDRTYVPIRFSAENLGCVVDWLNSTRQIVIVYY